MVCKKPKIRKNPQNFNDFADIFVSEWYARYAWYAVNYAPAPYFHISHQIFSIHFMYLLSSLKWLSLKNIASCFKLSGNLLPCCSTLMNLEHVPTIVNVLSSLSFSSRLLGSKKSTLLGFCEFSMENTENVTEIGRLEASIRISRSRPVRHSSSRSLSCVMSGIFKGFDSFERSFEIANKHVSSRHPSSRGGEWLKW